MGSTRSRRKNLLLKMLVKKELWQIIN